MNNNGTMSQSLRDYHSSLIHAHATVSLKVSFCSLQSPFMFTMNIFMLYAVPWESIFLYLMWFLHTAIVSSSKTLVDGF